MKRIPINTASELAPTITTSYSKGFAPSTVLIGDGDKITSGHMRMAIMEVYEEQQEA